MPDWSYHCLFKPLLFMLPARTAERLTLSAIGTLASLPGGPALLDAMGDMQPPARVRVNDNFASPVGLGAGMELTADAAKALSQFGFGFIEIGPITVDPVKGTIVRDTTQQSIISTDLPINRGLDYFAHQLKRMRPSIPIGVRLAHLPGTTFAQAIDELERMSAGLFETADYACVDTRWSVMTWKPDDQTEYLQTCVKTFERVLLLVEPGSTTRTLETLVALADKGGAAGFLVGGGFRQADGTRMFGASTKYMCRDTAKELRAWAPDAVLIASGGIMQPDDAFALFEAGADMVQVYSGPVYWGPQLAKRINEALLWRRGTQQLRDPRPYALLSVWRDGWLAFAIFGFGLVVPGIAAITVALTTVILPYDETFVHLQRQAFTAVNAHLLEFMQHDRITFAGTGISTGLLFAALSIFGARRGQKWAFDAVRYAGFFGFASFLLFLGFHYLDPLHALVCLVLLPFYIWGCFNPPRFSGVPSANLLNDRAWLRGLYGQFLFVCIGVGLLLAGATICKVGTSTVFVPEDLMFMHTTAEAITAHNPHMLPAIAHDRAGFGGALFTVGIGVIITALRGWRQGEGWLWWTLLVAGLPAFMATLLIHFFIGYTHFIHLAPAYIAFFMFAVGLWLSYRFLCDPPYQIIRRSEVEKT